MNVNSTTAQTTFICFILRLCFHEGKNHFQGRFMGNLLPTSCHLPTLVPLVKSLGQSEAAFLWKITPQRSFLLQKNCTAKKVSIKKYSKFSTVSIPQVILLLSLLPPSLLVVTLLVILLPLPSFHVLYFFSIFHTLIQELQ